MKRILIAITLAMAVSANAGDYSGFDLNGNWFHYFTDDQGGSGYGKDGWTRWWNRDDGGAEGWLPDGSWFVIYGEGEEK
jgi:hypothetical protein